MFIQPPSGPLSPQGSGSPGRGNRPPDGTKIARIIIAAILLLGAGIAVAFLTHSTEHGQAGPSRTPYVAPGADQYGPPTLPYWMTSSIPPPGTTIEFPDRQSIESLGIGACLNQIDGVVTQLPCTTPHTDQIFAKLTLTVTEAANAMSDARRQCVDPANQRSIRRSGLPAGTNVFVYFPNQVAFGNGDRLIVCTIQAPAGSMLTGSNVTTG